MIVLHACVCMHMPAQAMFLVQVCMYYRHLTVPNKRNVDVDCYLKFDP